MEVKRAIKSLALMPLLFLTACASSNAGFPTYLEIWERILKIGSLGFLESSNEYEGFMRIMVFILVFAVLFEGSRLIGFQQNTRIVITLVLAIISSIFMPAGVLAGIGIAYGTVVAFFLIGIPVFAGLYAIYVIPSNNRWQIAIKICVIALLLAILIQIRDHAIGGFALS